MSFADIQLMGKCLHAIFAMCNHVYSWHDQSGKFYNPVRDRIINLWAQMPLYLEENFCISSELSISSELFFSSELSDVQRASRKEQDDRFLGLMERMITVEGAKAGLLPRAQMPYGGPPQEGQPPYM